MTTIATGEQEVTYEGQTYTVLWAARGNCVYAPAKVDGPPEDCHPDESEVELTDVIAVWASDAATASVEDPAMLEALGKRLNNTRISNTLWEAFMEEEEDFDDSGDE